MAGVHWMGELGSTADPGNGEAVRPGRPVGGSGRDNDAMQKISLEALARQQVHLAAAAGGGHTADTVYGGHEKPRRSC
jgi:hypothetical protein